MPWFTIVLYFHLMAVMMALALAGSIHLGGERLRTATSVPEALAALELSARGGRNMRWAGLALVLTGAYLTQSVFSWSAPWIRAAIAGLAAIEALSEIGEARRRQLMRSCKGAGASGLVATQAAAASEVTYRLANFMLPMLTLGIMLIMVLQAGAAVSSAILILFAGGGAALVAARRQ